MCVKVKWLLFILLPITLLVSCGSRLPSSEPTLGIAVDKSNLNSILNVKVLKGLNSYKQGKRIVLEVNNLSNQALIYRPNEVQIFLAEDDEWVKISNKMKTEVVDFNSDENIEITGLDNNQDLILVPKGEFPDDMETIDVLPDVRSNNIVTLRIFVFAYPTEPKELSMAVAAAFVDITLVP